MITLFMTFLGIVTLVTASACAVNWNNVVIYFKGKRIAILGERAVGKTTLATFLSSGSIPEKYEQTLETRTVNARRFQLNELDLKVRQTRDVSGSKDAYSEWKKSIRGCGRHFLSISRG
jgi:GTPase SAR1 family protein